MLQDLDFDVYFDSTNPNHQNANVLYREDGQKSTSLPNSHMLPSIVQKNLQHDYSMPLLNHQQQEFNIFDWEPQNHSSSSNMLSLKSTISSEGCISNEISPKSESSASYSMYNIRDEANKALNNFFAKNKRILYNLNQEVTGVNASTLPNQSSSIQKQKDNEGNHLLPPPEGHSMNSSPLINQLYQFKSPDYSLNSNEKDDATNYWRNTKRQTTTRKVSDFSTTIAPGKQLKKVAHNVIERRYRNNINDRIQELKDTVPALYKARICNNFGKSPSHDNEGDSSDYETEIVDGVEVAKKLNKATILKKATEYIESLKTTHEKIDKENLILQQILSKMPNGQDVLSRFLYQKAEFEKTETERLAQERQEAQEKARLERQRLLRERAAERAALSQLMPKPERKPYKRRQSKKPRKAKKSSSSENEIGSESNRVFMAIFMCFVFFADPPLKSPELEYHRDGLYSNMNNSSGPSNFYNETVQFALKFRLWSVARCLIYSFGIFYICLLPLVFRWFRPQPAKKLKKCFNHFHYADEITTAWNRLYRNLVQRVAKLSNFPALRRNDGICSTILQTIKIIINAVYIFVPSPAIKLLQIHAKPVDCPKELSRIGAQIRLNEVECLGGNPDASHLSILHSAFSILVQFHTLKSNGKYIGFCDSTIARAHTSVALQLELCLPSFISSYLIKRHCKAAVKFLNNNQFVQARNALTTDLLVTNEQLHSKCHNQVLNILAARNGLRRVGCFSITGDRRNCRNAFYSFIIPYVISPLDLELYWQQLCSLEKYWLDYLDGACSVFSDKQLKQVLSTSITTSVPGYMLQWWIRVGIALESLDKKQQEHADILEEYSQIEKKKTFASICPFSSLLQRHQHMVCNLIEVSRALTKNTRLDKIPHLMNQGIKNYSASTECIHHIASTKATLGDPSNYEASVFFLSTIAVYLRALKALLAHKSHDSKHRSTSGPLEWSASQASIYIAQLREQILQYLCSSYANVLSAKCEKYIALYISKADDILNL